VRNRLRKWIHRNPLATLIKVATRSYRRRQAAMSYYRPTLANIKSWSRKHTERTNFYYDLTPINKEHLAHLLTVVTGSNFSDNIRYFQELESDLELKEHIQNGLRQDPSQRDVEAQFGRRIGWYALIRAKKPQIVIETGVDTGVGACVIARALQRNSEEGFQGRYFGTEINPNGGVLFTGSITRFGEVLYGDSIESLEKFEGEVDVFINDSDHDPTYEYREYRVIFDKLSDDSVILSDNAHVSNKLALFSRETGRKFVFFGEKPRDHWYPGAGIGISF
jgi:predicted O-methyltransferase YrrM